MINITQKSKCNGCHACAQICPPKCIEMVCDNEGFLYPTISASQCTECGLCEKTCPVLTHKLQYEEKEITAYAAFNKDENVRLKSSSGGIFSLLANYIFSQNGIVFGAAFDHDFNVIHSHAENTEELEALLGSKYVQSSIGDCYQRTKEILKTGRLVLFSGTPCQIEGLLSYLKKPYDNLITQDLICHGVPSPMVWRHYIKYRESAANDSTLQKVSFRSKDTGWKEYSISLSFENGKEYRAPHDKDPMMQVFLHNLCLRPSCYDCAFKSKARRSDITLADFWGIQNLLSDMDDNKGTSLVFIQSPKGEEIFSRIMDSLTVVNVNTDKAISYNTSMINSSTLPKKRGEFLKRISAKKFVKVQSKYCKATFINKTKRFLAKCLKKAKRMIKG